VDFRAFRLTVAERNELLVAQDECTIAWTNVDGWPVGVVHTYLWTEGAFWVTAFRDKPRVARLTADPRAAVIVSSKGTSTGPGRMVGARASVVLHDDEDTKAWFYPAFAERAVEDELARPGFVKVLGRQDRVIIELRPVSWTSFDGNLLRQGGRPD
jgi:hypothetical protein